MSDEINYNELSASFGVRTPSNKMEGVFTLYRKDIGDLDSTLLIGRRESDDLAITFGVKIDRLEDKNATLKVMYKDNEEIDITFDVVGSSYLEAFIEVKPNGRMFGVYEILPPPRVNMQLTSIADAYTRSREDLTTLNYGTLTRMMIGSSETDLGYDYSDSFVKFGDFKDQFKKMAILEKANLRLYYTGDFFDNTLVEIHTANKDWNEVGITHINKPTSDSFIVNNYTLNRVEKYIEFDVMDLLLKWISGEEKNYGLIIKSFNNFNTQFYTKESKYPPVLDIQYISNEIYSAGKAERDLTMFIWGVGNSDKQITFEVHSDYGDEDREITFYVHRADTPLDEEVEMSLIVSKPDFESEITVAIREEDAIDATITVRRNGEGLDREKVATIAVSRDTQDIVFNVDPNAFLPISLSVKGRVEHDDRQEGYISVTRPDLNCTFYIRGYANEDLESVIEVPNYENLEVSIAVSKPDLDITFDVHTIEEMEATLYVKERDDIEVTFLVMQHNDLDVTLDIKYALDTELEFTVSKPDLEVFFYPRVIGEDDREITWQVRQLDASDLICILTVGGQGDEGYYFIM